MTSGGLMWGYQSAKPVSSDTSTKDFLITKGSGASQIGNKLANEGLIKSPVAFKLYVQATGKQSKIQAGEYRLSPSFSLFKIVDELVKGPVEIWVTIPEGLRREEIAQRFSLSFARDGNFYSEFLEASKGKEGFLFPDTYLFSKTASASAIVKRMEQVFDQRVDGKMKQDIEAGEFSLNQIITMASIIERETKTFEERPVVAGILYKRLKAGWPLQADATLQYAIANSKFPKNWWEPLTKDDIALNSPYNTYKFKGLPPGPIANPGLSSIKAGVYPQKSEFWFYLHDSKGQVHYAKDIKEHNENIRTYIKNI